MIRFVQSDDGKHLDPVYRGKNPAAVNSLSFRPLPADYNGAWFVACTSEKQTCHIFLVKFAEADKQEKKNISTISSVLGFFAPSIQYFKCEGSFAKFKIPASSN